MPTITERVLVPEEIVERNDASADWASFPASKPDRPRYPRPVSGLVAGGRQDVRFISSLSGWSRTMYADSDELFGPLARRAGDDLRPASAPDGSRLSVDTTTQSIPSVAELARRSTPAGFPAMNLRFFRDSTEPPRADHCQHTPAVNHRTRPSH